MKKFLLSGLLCVAFSTVSASGLTTTKFMSQQAQKKSSAKIELANGKTIELKKKAMPSIDKNLIPAKPAVRKSVPARAEEESQDAFFESFEGWPIEEGDLNWIPDGWTVERTASVDDMESWFPYFQYNYAYPTPANGQYYFCIFYGEDQDERLITPEIEVGEGMELYYYLYYSPFYLFSDANFDYDTYEYDGEKIVAATFEVLVKAEGDQEWTLIQDIADKYKDYTGLELLYAQPTDMERQTVNLADYYGKKVQFAFRYVGSDGDAMFFDAVRVGIAPLEAVSYELPADTFYWGFTDEFGGLNGVDVAQVPVLEPVTFFNTSKEDATYTWHYEDPATGEEMTDDSQESLELVYEPLYQYSDETTLANNLFTAPTLVASAPGKADGEYSPMMMIQAGGVSNMKMQGNLEKFTLFPFATSTVKISGYTVKDDEVGDIALPVFGHNANTNQYWFNYTANGDEDANPEKNYNHTVGIANLYMPEAGKNLVVNGVHAFGIGLIQSDAELTFSIYGLPQVFDEEGDPIGISTEPSTFKTIATKTIKGSDIIYANGDSSQKDYICLPFDFDETAVVTATDEYPAFFFMLEGFNSDKVDYFMPMQIVDAPEGSMNLAYMYSKIDFETVSGRPAYDSIKTLRYKEDGDYIGVASAFAFGVVAEFPWLTCGVEEVTIGADESEVKVALGSYYDASKLTVEAPEGLTAEVAGRYDKCELTISRSESSDAEVSGTVTVSGPGVEVAVKVKADEMSGITEIAGAKAEAVAAYDLFGRRAVKTAKGLYIVKYADGSTRKQVVD